LLPKEGAWARQGGRADPSWQPWKQITKIATDCTLVTAVKRAREPDDRVLMTERLDIGAHDVRAGSIVQVGCQSLARPYLFASRSERPKSCALNPVHVAFLGSTVHMLHRQSRVQPLHVRGYPLAQSHVWVRRRHEQAKLAFDAQWCLQCTQCLTVSRGQWARSTHSRAH